MVREIAEIGCILITGSKKAFAAGADIKEMREQSYMDAYYSDFITRNWERAARTRKPLIAAVNGYALGGGCGHGVEVVGHAEGEAPHLQHPHEKEPERGGGR